jgi:hypothetical protein
MQVATRVIEDFLYFRQPGIADSVARALAAHGAQEAQPADKDVRSMPTPVRLAQEVATRLGQCEVLLRPLPRGGRYDGRRLAACDLRTVCSLRANIVI